MRKLSSWLAVLPLLTVLAVPAGAAVLGDAGPRETLLTTVNMHRISVGGDYLFLNRKVNLGNSVQKLEIQNYGGEIGVDLRPWLTAFAGAGSSQGRCNEESVWGESDMSWLAGLRADVWKYNLADPNFLAGQLSFAAEAQFAQYSSKTAGRELTGDEWFAALTLGYEIFVDHEADVANVPYSVRLTVGPALSDLSGQMLGQDYDAKDTLGFVAGCELFISHNLSAGAHYLCFGSSSFNASLRYHF